MTAAISSLIPDYFTRERHAAKKLARLLGCSLWTGKRYIYTPELFPASRAERLLEALRREDEEAERRLAERRRKREAVENAIREALGLSDSGLPLHVPGSAVRVDSRAADGSERVVPEEGR